MRGGGGIIAAHGPYRISKVGRDSPRLVQSPHRLDASRRATSPAFPRVFETKRRAPRGRKNKVRPLMMHNIGGGQVLEDMLFGYQITGHFRYGLA